MREVYEMAKRMGYTAEEISMEDFAVLSQIVWMQAQVDPDGVKRLEDGGAS